MQDDSGGYWPKDNFTLCFSIKATMSAILFWHLISVSSLLLMASVAVRCSFFTCRDRSICAASMLPHLPECTILLTSNKHLFLKLCLRCCFGFKVIKQIFTFLFIWSLNIFWLLFQFVYLWWMKNQVASQLNYNFAIVNYHLKPRGTSFSSSLDFAVSIAICFFKVLFWEQTSKWKTGYRKLNSLYYCIIHLSFYNWFFSQHQPLFGIRPGF